MMRAAREGRPTRLDLALVERGLVASRSRARDLIVRGFVLVDGVQVCKPSLAVSARTRIALGDQAPHYVSRGAEKLVAALDHFGFSAKDRVALDVGASTGGFTDVLLERGAKRVFAIDVGHDQLHRRLKQDPRVESLEDTDIRRLDRAVVGHGVDAIVVDVSFISLLKVLPAALALARGPSWLVALIKPQFEVGPAGVGKSGVVTDAAARGAAVERVETWLRQQSDWASAGVVASPLAGGSGNQEFLIGAVRHG